MQIEIMETKAHGASRGTSSYTTLIGRFLLRTLLVMSRGVLCVLRLKYFSSSKQYDLKWYNKSNLYVWHNFSILDKVITSLIQYFQYSINFCFFLLREKPAQNIV